MIPIINVTNEEQYWGMKAQYLTVSDVAGFMGCHRATVYRLLQRLPEDQKVQIHDAHHKKRYLVISHEVYKKNDCFRGVAPRGNPGFRSAAYQRQLKQKT